MSVMDTYDSPGITVSGSTHKGTVAECSMELEFQFLVKNSTASSCINWRFNCRSVRQRPNLLTIFVKTSKVFIIAFYNSTSFKFCFESPPN